MILDCGCVGNGGNRQGAIFQDGEHGAGKRVHNPMVADDTYRCTVCGAERKKPGKQLSKKEEKAMKEAEKKEREEKNRERR